MLVVGAIAATWAAAVMNVPAEAACAPSGATNTTTGTGEARIASTIFLVGSMRPPGVSSRTIRTWASSFVALSTARDRNRAVLGAIISSISTNAT